jgi:hypothetical protein
MRNALLAALLVVVAVPVAAGTIGVNGSGGEACAVVSALSDGGSSVSVCTPIDPRDGSFAFRNDGPIRLGGDDGFLVESLAFNGNVDPFLGYSVGVTDIGAPSAFSFTFGTPIVSDAYTHAAAGFFAVLLGADGTSVSLDPVAPATRLQESLAGTSYPTAVNLGIDVGSGCDGSGLVLCPPESSQAFFAPTALSVLMLKTTFLMSGGGDKAAVVGSLEVDKETQQVPEPGMLLMLGVGLAGIARRLARA